MGLPLWSPVLFVFLALLFALVPLIGLINGPKWWYQFQERRRRNTQDKQRQVEALRKRNATMTTIVLLNPSDPFSPTAHDVYHTTFLLRQLTIPDLIPLILDHAEYWTQTKVCSTIPKTVIQQNAGALYLSAPVVSRAVRKVVFTVTSRDQGWSSYPRRHGTYDASYSWFEVVIFQPDDADELAMGKVVVAGRRIITNIHAGRAQKLHVVEWSKDSQDPQVSDVLGELRGGHRIGLTVWARYPGWENHVSGASIRVYQSVVRRG